MCFSQVYYLGFYRKGCAKQIACLAFQLTAHSQMSVIWLHVTSGSRILKCLQSVIALQHQLFLKYFIL